VAGSLAGMLAARTGLSPVMVGRAAELARLRELAGASGDPAVALLSGEAGIGQDPSGGRAGRHPRPRRGCAGRPGQPELPLLKGPFCHSIPLRVNHPSGGQRCWSEQQSIFA
jgi:hypothetical protein